MVISENYYLMFLLTPVVLFMAQTTSSTYKPIDNYLLTCGSPEIITFELRNFVPDYQHPSVRFKTQNSLVVSSNVSKNLSPIYQSARIFKSSASYQFDIKQKGWHWIRLYFHPLRKNLESSSVTVTTENLVLLKNFSFERSRKSLFKEYAVNVKANTLTITFVPSRNSPVFINAIEVVSLPNKVFPVSYRPQNLAPFSFQSISHVAFETMYRINMGDSLAARSDIFHRTWQNDEKYLKTKVFSLNVSVDPDFIISSSTEIAPKMVYATGRGLKNASVSNLTWVFSVDPRFSYILRLHFCDIIVGSSNKSSSFNVYINSGILLKNLNLSVLTNGTKGVPFFIDFPSNSSRDSHTLGVTLEPSDQKYAILNGLEIMKIINKVQNLDGISSVDDIILKSDSKVSIKAAIILGCVLGALVLLVLIGILYYYMVARKSKTTSSNFVLPAISSSLASPGRMCRIFTFQEILEATNNFEEKSLLGIGGFGKVYMGKLDDGTKVAVKRANPRSKQGLAEFQNEVRLLSKHRHRHLVALIGYCMVLNCNCPGTNTTVRKHEKMWLLQDKIVTNYDSIPQFKTTGYHREQMELILVYEFMANGSLNDHLNGENLVALSWKQRLEICIGAARGLHYLHTGSSQSIIHRDVKVGNILLDENFVAKVSDFGISRNGPELGQSHVSTVVKGSFGYLDPEYFRTRHLTEKSDVYSFGVVLMEILCGRPALDHNLPTMEKNLARWALGCCGNGELGRIIDRSLIGKAKSASVWKVWEVARKCLEEHRIKRPTMGYVMCSLEDALHLELRNADEDGNFYYDCNMPVRLPQLECIRNL